jgi:3',5'-cyclic AMP phosphodiesterase CpdA
MTDLKPSTTYYYQVGSSVDDRWSEVHSFTTFTPGKELNFAIVADMAYDNLSDNTVASLTRLVDEGKLDAVIHSGDISYADGYMPHFDDFLNKVQPIATRVPYMTTPGNHEFGYNFSAYKSRFFMPGQLAGDGSTDGMYYSWDYGDVHFAAMNSESPIDTALFPQEEYDWFDADLKTHATSVWKVAHFHRPLYCAKDVDCGKHLITAGVEELLFQNHVDIAFVAHEHSYERTFPMYQGKKAQEGEYAPVYMMQGASGNREGNKGEYPPLSELPDWVAGVDNDIGYGILTQSADGQTLSWSFFNSETGAALDTAQYSK